MTDLKVIPGVGESIKKMFLRLETIERTKIDRCVLYVFRSSVYYASNEVHNQELLKWWNWKDK